MTCAAPSAGSSSASPDQHYTLTPDALASALLTKVPRRLLRPLVAGADQHRTRRTSPPLPLSTRSSPTMRRCAPRAAGETCRNTQSPGPREDLGKPGQLALGDAQLDGEGSPSMSTWWRGSASWCRRRRGRPSPATRRGPHPDPGAVSGRQRQPGREYARRSPSGRRAQGPRSAHVVERAHQLARGAFQTEGVVEVEVRWPPPTTLLVSAKSSCSPPRTSSRRPGRSPATSMKPARRAPPSARSGGPRSAPA